MLSLESQGPYQCFVARSSPCRSVDHMPLASHDARPFLSPSDPSLPCGWAPDLELSWWEPFRLDAISASCRIPAAREPSPFTAACLLLCALTPPRRGFRTLRSPSEPSRWSPALELSLGASRLTSPQNTRGVATSKEASSPLREAQTPFSRYSSCLTALVGIAGMPLLGPMI